MNSKELMIGNYFEVLTKHLNRITAITETEVQLYSESEKIHFTISIENLKPIELSDEWLLAFGFEAKKVPNNMGIGDQLFEYYEHKESGFIIYKSKFGYCLESVVRNTLELKNIFYTKVHALQNLFFALKKKELILN
jgi:hypothetical protein